MSSFTSVVNVLRRANELEGVGNQATAIQQLHNALTSKRHRNWTKASEDVIIKYLDLCVATGKSSQAKDGLHQYKSTVQNVNLASLETVVRYFIKISEEKAEKAVADAEEQGLVIMDEQEDTPTAVLLAAASNQTQPERASAVAPAIRFLWDCYRSVLEIVRMNIGLEDLYHETAANAFKFCVRYVRKSEFRRLCEVLRTHFTSLQRYGSQPQNVALTSQASIEKHIKTRFVQLEKARELSLFQETFRTIEDLNQLMAFDRGSPSTATIIGYYRALSSVFLTGNDWLFHAYSHQRLYETAVAAADTEQDAGRLSATKCVLAALSVLPSQADEEGTSLSAAHERDAHLTQLVGTGVKPTRDSLVADLDRRGILDAALPFARPLVRLLENSFNPLALPREFKKHADAMAQEPELQVYLAPMTNVMMWRLLKQLSSVYEEMHVSQLLELLPWMSASECERHLVSIARRQGVPMRLDHQRGMVSFVGEELESDYVKSHLTDLAVRLSAIVAKIHPEDVEVARARRSKLLGSIQANLDREHQRILARKQAIEERKRAEEEAKRKAAMLRAQKAREAEIERRRKEAEALEEAAKLRAQAINAKERGEIQQRETLEHAKAMERSDRVTTKKAKELVTQLEEKEGLTQAESLRIQAELERENRRAQLAEAEKKNARINGMSRKFDALERALRENEAPMIAKAYEEQKVHDRAFYDTEVERFYKNHKAAHDAALAEKARLGRMTQARTAFEESLLARRKEAYEKARAEQEERLAARREELRALREEQRAARAEAKAAWEQRRAEREAARAAQGQQGPPRDAPHREPEPRGGEDEGGEWNDVPKRTSWRDRERERGGYGGDRERGGYGGDRERGGYGDRERGGYGDRERGGYGGDRERGGYGGDRERGGYGGDRPSWRDRERERGGYGGDRYGGDRGGYGRERGGDRGGYGGDRDRGGYGGDRGGYGGDRGGYGGDRERGGYGGDRDRGDRPSWRDRERERGGYRGGDRDGGSRRW